MTTKEKWNEITKKYPNCHMYYESKNKKEGILNNIKISESLKTKLFNLMIRSSDIGGEPWEFYM